MGAGGDSELRTLLEEFEELTRSELGEGRPGPSAESRLAELAELLAHVSVVQRQHSSSIQDELDTIRGRVFTLQELYGGATEEGDHGYK